MARSYLPGCSVPVARSLIMGFSQFLARSFPCGFLPHFGSLDVHGFTISGWLAPWLWISPGTWLAHLSWIALQRMARLCRLVYSLSRARSWLLGLLHWLGSLLFPGLLLCCGSLTLPGVFISFGSLWRAGFLFPFGLNLVLPAVTAHRENVGIGYGQPARFAALDPVMA